MFQRRMKKTIFSLIFAGLVFNGAVLKVAQSEAPTSGGNATKPPQTICSNLDALEEKAEDKLATHMAKALEKQIERDKKIKTQRETEVKNLAKKQKVWQTRQEENNKKLLKITKNESQKTLLLDFQSATTQATYTKKIDIDKALADFHDAVDVLILKRNEAGNDSVESYKALINNGFDRARSSCASGEDETQVRKNLHTAMQKAKAKYQQALQEMSNHRQQVRDLAQIKNTAIKQAVENFKATVLAEKENMGERI